MRVVASRASGADRERSNTRIVGLFLFLLLLSVFFYRGTLFGSMTGALVIPVAAIAVGVLVVVPTAWQRGTITITPPAATAFALAVIVNVLANGALYPSYTGLTVLFGLEMALNLLLYYVAVAYTTAEEQPVVNICKALMLAAAPMIIAISVLATALATIRRVGGSEQIGTAVNHLAHSLVVAVVAAHYMTVRPAGSRSMRVWAGVMLIASVLGVILTGSRASMVALLLFAAAVVGITSRRLRVSLLPLVAAAASLLVLLGVFGGRIGPLIRRFSFDVIRDATMLRLNVMLRAFNDVRVFDLVLGVPWRYQPLAPVDPIVYPHNFGLSMLLHVGVLPFALFTYLIVTRLWRLTRAATSDADWREPFALASMLMVTVLYASTSGRLTRVLTIFFALGVADGWLYHRKAVPDAGGRRADGDDRNTTEALRP